MGRHVLNAVEISRLVAFILTTDWVCALKRALSLVSLSILFFAVLPVQILEWHNDSSLMAPTHFLCVSKVLRTRGQHHHHISPLHRVKWQSCILYDLDPLTTSLEGGVRKTVFKNALQEHEQHTHHHHYFHHHHHTTSGFSTYLLASAFVGDA